jgi:hypothetical protein
MLGVPKPESDTIIDFLFHQVAEDVDFEVRFYWEQNSGIAAGSVLFLLNEKCGV